MLHTSVVIFTSSENQPLHIQHPTYVSIMNPFPIYVAYLQTGLGHYDAVVPSSVNVTEEDLAVSDSRKCNCGRMTTKGNPCSFSLMQYTCKCPCYNSKQPCRERCRCKGCSNTFGVKPLLQTLTKQKRKRSIHEAQSIPLKGRKAIRFLADIGESMCTGRCSKMEYLTVCSIAESLMEEECDWDEVQQVEVSEVFSLYQNVTGLSNMLKLEIALHDRRQEEIAAVVRRVYYLWDIFQHQNMAHTVKMSKTQN